MVWRRRVNWVAAAAGLIVGVIVAEDLLRGYRAQARYDAGVSEIVRAVNWPKSDSQRFDALRIFIDKHTAHKIDAEFFRLRAARLFPLEIMAHARGERKEPVHMECSQRAAVMAAVLAKMGYEVRNIAVFDTDRADLNSHSFMEVKNPATGRWETQDPDYEIYWRDKRTGERASVVEDAKNAVRNLEPCDVEGCGWKPRLARLRTYFDIFTVKPWHGERYSIFSPHAHPHGPFEHNGRTGSFCEVMKKRCAAGFEPAK